MDKGWAARAQDVAAEGVVGVAIPLLALVGGDEVLAAPGSLPERAAAAAFLAAVIGLCSVNRATLALGKLRAKAPGTSLDIPLTLITVAGTSAIPLTTLAVAAYDGISWAAARHDPSWVVGAASALAAATGIAITFASAFAKRWASNLLGR